MRVIKHYSLIALFVALNTSFKDQIIGSRVFRFHPEHPRISYVGAEADDWPTLRFNKNGRTGGKNLTQNIILHKLSLFS